jgi:uncharacterized protein (TIGR03435 family)
MEGTKVTETDDPRPSLFTALQEQLGIRLEPARAQRSTDPAEKCLAAGL